ncbi:CS1 type fimbrial major subunit [Psychromonas ossibalaenae]|uniref:CS1 type fimbrial major subunit n=1 Tax=Psychromonas ossibalaenae TaxID=444922 RepID=UPI00037821F6|nr:CS1 type fimbrial major subunit [Psychromonas ossibalaenae]
MKKLLVATALVTTMFSAGALAATGDQITKSIQVTATVPSSTFSVEPTAGQWPTQVELNYDVNVGFDSWNTTLKSVSGDGVNASLMGTPMLVSGQHSIPLIVTVGTQVLDNTPRKVADDAAVHGIALSVTTDNSGYATFEAGNYSGTVQLVFEDNI